MLEFVRLVRFAGLMVRLRYRLKIGEARILRGNGGRLRFDDQARRHQIGRRNAGDPLHNVGELGCFTVDERAAADMALQGAIARDRFDRPPQRIARDAVLRGELAFGRQPPARRPLAGGYALAQRSFDRACHHFGQRLLSLYWTGREPIIISRGAAANC